MFSHVIFYELALSPATEDVVMIRPPLPPFDLLMRSTAYVIPVVAPIVITERFKSIPASKDNC